MTATTLPMLSWAQKPLKAAKYHDYFTSALPEPQKGPDVLLPLGTLAPVVGAPLGNNMTSYDYENDTTNKMIVGYRRTDGNNGSQIGYVKKTD